LPPEGVVGGNKMKRSIPPKRKDKLNY